MTSLAEMENFAHVSPRHLTEGELAVTEDYLHPKWVHLENVERIKDEVPEFFNPTAMWLVTEKIHGFNARIGKTIHGDAWIGTRNKVVGDDAADDAEQGFVGWARSILHRLPIGTTIYGEWAGKGIQKGIDYGERQFYAFAGRWARGDLMYWPTLLSICEEAGLKTVPVLYYDRNLPNWYWLDAQRTAISLLATTTREGIVMTQDPPYQGPHGYLIGKFKSPAFSEVAHAKREQPTPADLTNITAFVDEFATVTRLEHVLQQAVEEGPYDPWDVRMTGTILRLMYEDVVRESGSAYLALTKEDQKLLGKVLNNATKKLMDAERTAMMRDYFDA